MGVTKSDIFSKEQNQLATMAKAVAHPARIAILQHILKVRSCICGDLVDEIGLAQATISQHLRELKNAGLLQGNVEGTSVCYCIHPETYKQFQKMFEELFGKDINGLQCC